MSALPAQARYSLLLSSPAQPALDANRAGADLGRDTRFHLDLEQRLIKCDFCGDETGHALGAFVDPDLRAARPHLQEALASSCTDPMTPDTPLVLP